MFNLTLVKAFLIVPVSALVLKLKFSFAARSAGQIDHVAEVHVGKLVCPVERKW
jgi:hypothetical protein